MASSQTQGPIIATSSIWQKKITPPRRSNSTTSTTRTAQLKRQEVVQEEQEYHKYTISTNGETKSITWPANLESKRSPHIQTSNTHPQMRPTQCAHWNKHQNPKQKKSKTYRKSAQSTKNIHKMFQRGDRRDTQEALKVKAIVANSAQYPNVLPRQYEIRNKMTVWHDHRLPISLLMSRFGSTLCS